MPFQPKCCNSSLSTEISNLTFDKRIVVQQEKTEYALGGINECQTITTDILTTFASIKTKSTPQFFNGINQGTATTHIFTIRYTSTIYTLLQELTEQYWVLYNNKRYYIDILENVNEDNILIRLIAKVTGKDDNQLSKNR